jgi:hypothetical protein
MKFDERPIKLNHINIKTRCSVFRPFRPEFSEFRWVGTNDKVSIFLLI